VPQGSGALLVLHTRKRKGRALQDYYWRQKIEQRMREIAKRTDSRAIMEYAADFRAIVKLSYDADASSVGRITRLENLFTH